MSSRFAPDSGGGFGIQFPKLGPVSKWTLILLALMSISQAILVNMLNAPAFYLALVGDTRAIQSLQLWRLLTASILSPTQSLLGTLFPLIGIFFFLPPVEQRWGVRRTLLFLIGTAVFANTVTVLLDFLPVSHALLHVKMFTGYYSVLTALSVAFALSNPDAVIRLFFVLPVPGRMLTWVTLALTVLSIVYSDHGTEGPFAALAGWCFGMLFGGTPSLMRSLYLRRKLQTLEQQTKRSGPQSTRKPKNAAGLRVVYGGLADDLEVEGKPRDKDSLN
jgi:membrane associated rhomboid family serine protease